MQDVFYEPISCVQDSRKNESNEQPVEYLKRYRLILEQSESGTYGNKKADNGSSQNSCSVTIVFSQGSSDETYGEQMLNQERNKVISLNLINCIKSKHQKGSPFLVP